MSRASRWGLLVLLCGAGRMLCAAETPVPVMTLDEAFGYARSHQPQIRSALAEVSARLQEARVPRAAWYPQVGGTVQLLYGTANNTTASYLNVPETDLPRIGGTTSVGSARWSPSPSTLVALTVDQEVYDFGRIAARAAVTDALAEVARANAETALLEVQLAVEEAFHGVLTAKEILKATEDAYKRAAAHRDYAQAGTRSGLRPPIELTRAQADVAQLEVRRVRAQTGLEAARAALAAAIGSDSLQVDAQPLSAKEQSTPVFEEALRLASVRNPLIAAAWARIRAQENTTRAVLRELAPNVFASGTLSGRAGGAAPSTMGTGPYGDGWLPDVANWHLGLVLEWNIFDAAVLARRSAARAREEVARADLDVARTSVTLLVERAHLDLQAAKRALPGLDEAVRAAQANQAQADARFRAGLGTTVELADAEALLTNAQLERAIGEFVVARARAQLGRVIGENLLVPSAAERRGR